jgi:glycerophosphoryl diester phosphodiesterase|nr:MAG: glycerophosphodiester phosphodiesterase [Bacteroidota bacterium]
MNIVFVILLLLVCVTHSDAQTSGPMVPDNFPKFFKEGHRGARGLIPENTIPSMKRAIDEGANVLELDVHISRDNQVVVAHDPYINRIFSLMPDGSEIPESDARKFILHQMDYDDIRKFDVGSKPHPEFPQQQNMPTYIPLLGELIDSVEAYTRQKGSPPVIYNIEIKANPKDDGHYQPKPAELVDLVMSVVRSRAIGNRFYIQSFDVRQIQEVQKRYPDVATGFLSGNKDMSLEDNLKLIGFRPHIYSVHYSLVTPELVKECQQLGMKFIPWTVNDLGEMKRLIDMGVDGIITDYPDKLSQLR